LLQPLGHDDFDMQVVDPVKDSRAI